MTDPEKAREMAATLRGIGRRMNGLYLRRNPTPAENRMLDEAQRHFATADLLDALADKLEPGEDVAGLVERLDDVPVAVYPSEPGDMMRFARDTATLKKAAATLTTLAARVREAEALCRQRGRALARLGFEVSDDGEGA